MSLFTIATFSGTGGGGGGPSVTKCLKTKQILLFNYINDQKKSLNEINSSAISDKLRVSVMYCVLLK